MVQRMMLILVLVAGTFVTSGCQSTTKRTVLTAPAGTNGSASRHNDEGIQAYEQSQWAQAKQHFEAAIQTAPGFAEAHYNLGMALYKLGVFKEGDQHFIEAANLSPGNKVIWNSPPLAGVSVPEKEVPMPGHGGDGHSH